MRITINEDDVLSYDLARGTDLTKPQVNQIARMLYLSGGYTPVEAVVEAMSGKYEDHPKRGPRVGRAARVVPYKRLSLRVIPPWREAFRSAAKAEGLSSLSWARKTLRDAADGWSKIDTDIQLEGRLSAREATKMHVHLPRSLYAQCAVIGKRYGFKRPGNTWALRALLGAVKF